MTNTSIKNNFAYQMVYDVLVFLLPFVTSPYIARVIGAEGIGIYTYSYSVVSYFVLVAQLGIKNYGNRVIAKSRDDHRLLCETFSNVLSIHLLISLVCFLAYSAYAFFVKKGEIFAVLQIFWLFGAMFDISWFYFGIEYFKITVIRNVAIKLLNIVCIFVFVRTANDLPVYCFIMSFGSLLSSIVLWMPIKKYIRIISPRWSMMYPHLKPLLVLFVPTVAISLYKYMDKIMIGFLSGNTQLGIYENAERVSIIPLTIIASFGTVMLPRMSNMISKGNSELSRKYIAQSIKYVMCFAFALAFGMAAVGPVFASIFWGEEFYDSGIMIMGLAVTIPFVTFANVIRTQYLIPNSKDKEYMISVIIGALLNLIVNLLLIPRYGAFGAVAGTIAAEISVCIVQSFAVRKELPLGKYVGSCRIFVLFGLLMFVGTFGLGKLLGVHVYTFFIQVFAGCLFYISVSSIYFSVIQDRLFYQIVESIQRKMMKR